MGHTHMDSLNTFNTSNTQMSNNNLTDSSPSFMPLSNFNGHIDESLKSVTRMGFYTPESSSKVINNLKSTCDLSVFHINIRSLNVNYI